MHSHRIEPGYSSKYNHNELISNKYNGMKNGTKMYLQNLIHMDADKPKYLGK